MKKITEATANHLQTDFLRGGQMMKEYWIDILNPDGTITRVWV